MKIEKIWLILLSLYRLLYLNFFSQLLFQIPYEGEIFTMNRN